MIKNDTLRVLREDVSKRLRRSAFAYKSFLGDVNRGEEIECPFEILHEDNNIKKIILNPSDTENGVIYCKDNKIHRDNGPAVILNMSYCRLEAYYTNGFLSSQLVNERNNNYKILMRIIIDSSRGSCILESYEPEKELDEDAIVLGFVNFRPNYYFVNYVKKRVGCHNLHGPSVIEYHDNNRIVERYYIEGKEYDYMDYVRDERTRGFVRKKKNGMMSEISL